jgi:MoxR-like ATPase
VNHHDLFLVLKQSASSRLVQAEVAFIDEVFKANSAILNTLLTLLNERLFDNGNERLPVPLVCLVAASNELPESEELGALYDRFLIRCAVKQVRCFPDNQSIACSKFEHDHIGFSQQLEHCLFQI